MKIIWREEDNLCGGGGGTTGAPDPPRPVVGVAADIYRVDRIEAASVGCVCEQTRYLDPRYAFFWQFVSITS